MTSVDKTENAVKEDWTMVEGRHWGEAVLDWGEEGTNSEEEGPHLKKEGPHLEEKGPHLEEKGPHMEEEGSHLEEEALSWGKNPSWEEESSHLEEKDQNLQKEILHWREEGSKWEKVPQWEEEGSKWEKVPQWEEEGSHWEEKAPQWQEEGPHWEEKVPQWQEEDPQWEGKGPHWEEEGTRWEKESRHWEEEDSQLEEEDSQLEEEGPYWGKYDFQLDLWGDEKEESGKKENKKKTLEVNASNRNSQKIHFTSESAVAIKCWNPPLNLTSEKRNYLNYVFEKIGSGNTYHTRRLFWTNQAVSHTNLTYKQVKEWLKCRSRELHETEGTREVYTDTDDVQNKTQIFEYEDELEAKYDDKMALHDAEFMKTQIATLFELDPTFRDILNITKISKRVDPPPINAFVRVVLSVEAFVDQLSQCMVLMFYESVLKLDTGLRLRDYEFFDSLKEFFFLAPFGYALYERLFYFDMEMNVVVGSMHEKKKTLRVVPHEGMLMVGGFPRGGNLLELLSISPPPRFHLTSLFLEDTVMPHCKGITDVLKGLISLSFKNVTFRHLLAKTATTTFPLLRHLMKLEYFRVEVNGLASSEFPQTPIFNTNDFAPSVKHVSLVGNVNWVMDFDLPMPKLDYLHLHVQFQKERVNTAVFFEATHLHVTSTEVLALILEHDIMKTGLRKLKCIWVTKLKSQMEERHERESILYLLMKQLGISNWQQNFLLRRSNSDDAWRVEFPSYKEETKLSKLFLVDFQFTVTH